MMVTEVVDVYNFATFVLFSTGEAVVRVFVYSGRCAATGGHSYFLFLRLYSASILLPKRPSIISLSAGERDSEGKTQTMIDRPLPSAVASAAAVAVAAATVRSMLRCLRSLGAKTPEQPDGQVNSHGEA